MTKKLFIGAHTSTAGGLHNALTEGVSIGANTVQLFTSNQRQWKGRVITQEILDNWYKAREETGLEHLMSHGSYLVNLGSPVLESLEKSKNAFEEEIKRCQALDISYLNFHPGAAVGSTEEECLNTIIDSLNSYEKLLEKGKTTLLLETTAGQGTNVGYTFEHLAYIIQNSKIPLGVCIDTCHIFSAGYDIRKEEGWNQVLDEFDKTIGLKYLKAFHLNDSLRDLGERRDRHAHLGEGKIGLESFQFLIRSPKTNHLPMYLETPNKEHWAEEILLLRSFATNSLVQ